MFDMLAGGAHCSVTAAVQPTGCVAEVSAMAQSLPTVEQVPALDKDQAIANGLIFYIDDVTTVDTRYGKKWKINVFVGAEDGASEVIMFGSNAGTDALFLRVQEMLEHSDDTVGPVRVKRIPATVKGRSDAYTLEPVS